LSVETQNHPGAVWMTRSLLQVDDLLSRVHFFLPVDTREFRNF